MPGDGGAAVDPVAASPGARWARLIGQLVQDRPEPA